MNEKSEEETRDFCLDMIGKVMDVFVENNVNGEEALGILGSLIPIIFNRVTTPERRIDGYLDVIRRSVKPEAMDKDPKQ